MYRLLPLFFLFSFSLSLGAQVFPLEGAKLNYRIIGISFPKQNGVSNYKIEIANGNYNAAEDFKKNIVQTLHTKQSKVIAEVPSFGSEYTWRVVYMKEEKGIDEQTFHHFSTATIPEADTNTERLRVLVPAEKYKDAYVLLDGNAAMYDMEGRPVWFLPVIDSTKAGHMQVRDLKSSSRGTLTFLVEHSGAYEINYDGHILWSAPDDGKESEQKSLYHHEFTRLPSGHYMVLGAESELMDKPLPATTKPAPAKGNELPPTALIEYDSKQHIVWSWTSSDYLKNSDIYAAKNSAHRPSPDAHANAFFFDESNKCVYLSFRNISTVLRIKYPEGMVEREYCEMPLQGVPANETKLFCNQHSVRRSKNGYMYLYDNNVCGSEHFPKILKFEEPLTAGGMLKKIWEYDCTTEGILPGERAIYDFHSGGSVVELPGNDLFINMSGPYDKLFILDPHDEQILWSAIPERYMQHEASWSIINQYRASMLTRKELETLVWNAEQKSTK